MPTKKEKHYIIENSQLMAEWDWEKNNELGFDPQKLTYGMDKCKPWWICSKCGNSWQATPYHRASRGQNCPICRYKTMLDTRQKSIVKKRGSFGDNYPHLLLEWDTSKNPQINPYKIAAHSRQMVWWICPEGHEYQATIDARTGTNETGCPYCSNRKILLGYNDFATTHAQFLSEWNYERNGDVVPQSISFGYDKPLWWKCSKGHEYLSTISNRIKGSACPQCANETHSSFPEQALMYYITKCFPDAKNRYKINGKIEVDVFIPLLNLGIEYDGHYFHTSSSKQKEEKKDEILAQNNFVLIRIKDGIADCTYSEMLSNYKYVIYTSYDNRYAFLNSAINELFEILSGLSGKRIELDIDVMRDRDNILSLFYTQIKNNSIAHKHPELLLDWDFELNKLNPEFISCGVDKLAYWKCHVCGSSWKARISHRAKGVGCPYCSGRLPIEGINDLKTVDSDLAKEWNYERNGDITPEKVKPNSNKKVWWVCNQCRHEWQAVISARYRGNGCPNCAKVKRKDKNNE